MWNFLAIIAVPLSALAWLQVQLRLTRVLGAVAGLISALILQLLLTGFLFSIGNSAIEWALDARSNAQDPGISSRTPDVYFAFYGYLFATLVSGALSAWTIHARARRRSGPTW